MLRENSAGQAGSIPGGTKESTMGNTQKWQLIAFASLSLSLVLVGRTVLQWFNDAARTEVMITASMFTIVALGFIMTVYTLAQPKILEYKTRPRGKN
jgi:lipid-A-disaccharide synthase-like uncharacterized protein